MLKSLNNFEFSLYFTTWTCSVFYSVYSFSIVSSKFFENYNDAYNDFVDGWYILSRKRDKADFEWETINYYFYTIYPWIFVVSLITKVFRQLNYNDQTLKLWHISISLIFLISKFDCVVLLIVLLQPFLFLFFKSFGNKLSIWFCNLTCITFITYYKQFNTNEDFLIYLNLNEHNAYLIILSLCWINLRCTSITLDTLELNNNKKYYLNYFSYILYLPTLFCGPFILNEDFEKTFQPNGNQIFFTTLRNLIIGVVRCIFWMYFANFCLHYIYVNATCFQLELVESFDVWSLCGYGYAMGQFFHIKYVILYGLNTVIASSENITVPHLPRCIGRIHLYSDMWKYFDPGLYNFLLKYIYIPLMQNVPCIIKSKMLASLLCFGFVFIWHGIETYILIWTLLNFFGVTLEHVGVKLYKKYLQTNDFIKKLSPWWIQQLHCVAASPLLAITATSNFYFFTNTEIGNIFFIKLLNGSLCSIGGLLVALYACCQVSTQLRKVNANKM